MKNANIILWVGTVLAVACGAPERSRAADAADMEPPPIVLAATYSASGTHQCRSPDGEVHSCIVSGGVYGNCIDAESSLRAQDCCPSTSARSCPKDAQGRDVKCGRGGVSSGFTMNYCIPGGR